MSSAAIHRNGAVFCGELGLLIRYLLAGYRLNASGEACDGRGQFHALLVGALEDPLDDVFLGLIPSEIRFVFERMVLPDG